jgi:hypothetical protein
MQRASLVLVLIVACGDGDPVEDEIYTVTEVRIGNDGARDVKQSTITAAEQRAAIAWRMLDDMAEATGAPQVAKPTAPYNCFDATVWLFDGPGLGGNQLCLGFVGDPGQLGYVHLSEFVHHFDVQPGPLETVQYVPVGWDGRPMSMVLWWRYEASVYVDGHPSPIRRFVPDVGHPRLQAFEITGIAAALHNYTYYIMPDAISIP